MTRADLSIVLVAAACVGCGRRTQTGAANGSGSAQSASKGPADPLESWRTVRMTDDLAILVRGSQVAVLDHTGRVLSHPAITPQRAENAPMHGRVLAWLDGANEDDLHLVDMETGKQRWHATAAHRVDSVVFGSRSLAALTVEGVELHHLDDGSLGYHHAGPKVVDSVYGDGTFVFVDDTGIVEAVDEAHDAQRWTFDTKDGSSHETVDLEGADVVTRDWHINLTSGKAMQPKEPTRKTVEMAGIQDIARASQGTTLGAEAVGKQRKMYLFDASNGVVWSSSEWSRILERSMSFANHSDVSTNAESGVVVLEGDSPTTRTLVGFDNKTGHVRFDREMTRKDQLIGGDDGCIGFLERHGTPAFQCLDEQTGKVRWEHAMTGTTARAWHWRRVWLVASGTPAKLEELDNTGKVRWATVLPDTEVGDESVTGLLAHRGTPNESMWELGPTYLVLLDARSASLVDLTTGTLAQVAP